MRDKGSMSIVGIEKEKEVPVRCQRESAGTIFMKNSVFKSTEIVNTKVNTFKYVVLLLHPSVKPFVQGMSKEFRISLSPFRKVLCNHRTDISMMVTEYCHWGNYYGFILQCSKKIENTKQPAYCI